MEPSNDVPDFMKQELLSPSGTDWLKLLLLVFFFPISLAVEHFWPGAISEWLNPMVEVIEEKDFIYEGVTVHAYRALFKDGKQVWYYDYYPELVHSQK